MKSYKIIMKSIASLFNKKHFSLLQGLFLIFILSSKFSNAQNWGVSNVPHGRNINDIHILNTSQIVIAGGNESNDSLQEIFKSNDGGLDWISVIMFLDHGLPQSLLKTQ